MQRAMLSASWMPGWRLRTDLPPVASARTGLLSPSKRLLHFADGGIPNLLGSFASCLPGSFPLDSVRGDENPIRSELFSAEPSRAAWAQPGSQPTCSPARRSADPSSPASATINVEQLLPRTAKTEQRAGRLSPGLRAGLCLCGPYRQPVRASICSRASCAPTRRSSRSASVNCGPSP